MKIQRTLGTLTERPEAPLFQRLLPSLFRRRESVPIDMFGGVQSHVLMQPALFGKVLHLNPTMTSTSQIERVRQLLEQNFDVDVLAQQGAGLVTNYGCLSRRTITDNGVTAIAGGFAGAFTISNFKFHAFGTGTTAEAEAHANLVTELTTQYVVDSTRPTGSQANTAGAGGPPQVATYVTVGTLSPDSGGTIAITEHGIFAAAAGVGGGANTMLDRSVFSAVNLVAGSDSLQVTYTLSITANG